MQKIIHIYPCLLKLSRKQESVTDGRYYYIPHYRGGGKRAMKLPDLSEMSIWRLVNKCRYFSDQIEIQVG